MADGKAGLYMFGHGASLYDPFEALNLFHGKYSAVDRYLGGQQHGSRATRTRNSTRSLDEIAPLSSDDPKKFQEGAAQGPGYLLA